VHRHVTSSRLFSCLLSCFPENATIDLNSRTNPDQAPIKPDSRIYNYSTLLSSCFLFTDRLGFQAHFAEPMAFEVGPLLATGQFALSTSKVRDGLVARPGALALRHSPLRPASVRRRDRLASRDPSDRRQLDRHRRVAHPTSSAPSRARPQAGTLGSRTREAQHASSRWQPRLRSRA
jgi:hypothetical protein